MSRLSEVCLCDSGVARNLVLALQQKGMVSGPWAWTCRCEARFRDLPLPEVKPWPQVSLVL